MQLLFHLATLRNRQEKVRLQIIKSGCSGPHYLVCSRASWERQNTRGFGDNRTSVFFPFSLGYYYYVCDRVMMLAARDLRGASKNRATAPGEPLGPRHVSTVVHFFCIFSIRSFPNCLIAQASLARLHQQLFVSPCPLSCITFITFT